MKIDTFFVLSTSNQAISIENHNGFVLFYKKSKEQTVADIQMNLLVRLIENGLKLKSENFLIIDINAQKQRFSSLKKTIEIKKCFLFGVQESEIGINFDIDLYQLTKVASITFLKVDAPEVLEKDNGLKSKLWSQLQIAFKN